MNPLTLVKRIQKINTTEATLGISEDASWHAKYKDSAYVFAGGIPFDLTEGDLLAVFAQYGEVVDVNLVRDKATGKSRGFAFLAYEDQRSTILAVDNLNGAKVLGRIIRVDHVSNYKKKEEEDEEMEREMREARGVCLAYQRGECRYGSACKFSHNEERHANTGWGIKDSDSRWGHDKFEGHKRRHVKVEADEYKSRHAGAEINDRIERKHTKSRSKDHNEVVVDELNERSRHDRLKGASDQEVLEMGREFGRSRKECERAGADRQDEEKQHRDLEDSRWRRGTEKHSSDDKASLRYRRDGDWKAKQHGDVEDTKRQKLKENWVGEESRRGRDKHSRDDKNSWCRQRKDDDHGRN